MPAGTQNRSLAVGLGVCRTQKTVQSRRRCQCEHKTVHWQKVLVSVRTQKNQFTVDLGAWNEYKTVHWQEVLVSVRTQKNFTVSRCQCLYEHIYAHTNTHTHTHANTHTRAQTRTQRHTHIHKHAHAHAHTEQFLVSWCFEPSQPQRITSGLKTNLVYLLVIHKTNCKTFHVKSLHTEQHESYRNSWLHKTTKELATRKQQRQHQTNKKAIVTAVIKRDNLEPEQLATRQQ